MTVHSPPKKVTNPQEEALHLFCKQMLKSKLFKGLYKERFYVDAVKGYRDLIQINRNEKELKIILDDIENRLKQFYCSNSVWIGISSTMKLSPKDLPGTCLWVELDELAFNEYWFSVKSVKFRDNEIIVKVKPIRPVDQESDADPKNDYQSSDKTNVQDPINLDDFIKIVISWGASIKRTFYEFMSNDISKENLKAIVKFLILVIISLLTFSVEAIRFLGIFLVRFTMEFRKLLYVSTPILLRIIDLCGKIIGGFYILLAMIWRDVKPVQKQQLNQHMAITYNDLSYQRLNKHSNTPHYKNALKNDSN